MPRTARVRFYYVGINCLGFRLIAANALRISFIRFEIGIFCFAMPNVSVQLLLLPTYSSTWIMCNVWPKSMRQHSRYSAIQRYWAVTNSAQKVPLYFTEKDFEMELSIRFYQAIFWHLFEIQIIPNLIGATVFDLYYSTFRMSLRKRDFPFLRINRFTNPIFFT